MKRSGAVLAAAMCLTSTSPAAAEWRPPEKQPVRLRLDDSPALPLLAPYRHAKGRPRGSVERYVKSPFGWWSRRSWPSLDWGIAGVPPHPQVAPRDAHLDACQTRLLAAPAGYPLVRPEGHWFHVRRERQLSLDPTLAPPWLARLDAHYAHALIAAIGCGRGGPCSTGASFPAPAFQRMWKALAPHAWPIPAWRCKPRRFIVRAQGNEQEAFDRLVSCDGSIPEGVTERLSVLVRPRGVPRPALLGDEPAAGAGPGEWAPGVRLLHPRLLWALQSIADAFPWRAIYVYSGYRKAPGKPGGHRSRHWEGRAVDIAVNGVEKEALLAACHALPDVGCGYYPNNKFVHLDVRAPHTGKVVWVDASAPGEPTRNVSEWPGVVEGGRVVWKKDD